MTSNTTPWQTISSLALWRLVCAALLLGGFHHNCLHSVDAQPNGGPPSGGPPSGGTGTGGGTGGTTTGGSTAGQTSYTGSSCTPSSGSCAAGGTSNYINRTALTYNTTSGKFGGSIITNLCPNDALWGDFSGVHYGGTDADCVQQSFPATTYTVPSAAPLRGAVGFSIVGGVNIYGPFDDGFSTGQVCANGSCSSGTDVISCAAELQYECGSSYTAQLLLDSCGGHASPYHFHTDLVCDYNTSASGHSPLVGIALDGRGIYGKYETSQVAPTNLDACGGHYGNVPSYTIGGVTYPAATNVYHYHTQANAPFTIGCYGPVTSLSECMSLYSTCGTGFITYWTNLGCFYNYDLDCPCFSMNGSTYNQVSAIPQSECTSNATYTGTGTGSASSTSTASGSSTSTSSASASSTSTGSAGSSTSTSASSSSTSTGSAGSSTSTSASSSSTSTGSSSSTNTGTSGSSTSTSASASSTSTGSATAPASGSGSGSGMGSGTGTGGGPPSGGGGSMPTCTANTSTWAGQQYVRGDTCVMPASVANWSTNATTRTLFTNQIPPYGFSPYCPLGVGGQYCFSASDCETTGWTNCTCPSPGDCPYESNEIATFPINPTPNASATPIAAGGLVAWTLAGLQMQGPTDAGASSVVLLKLPFTCGAHVTPGFTQALYHFHVSPSYNVYSNGTVSDSCTVVMGVQSGTAHSPLYGYATDGYGLYGYYDIGGAAPVLDECGGHFGYTNDNNQTGTPVYHYHTQRYGVYPMYVGCLGPANGQCSQVNAAKNNNVSWFCGSGCGAKVCVQPGVTSTAFLTAYGYSTSDSNLANVTATPSGSSTNTSSGLSTGSVVGIVVGVCGGVLILALALILCRKRYANKAPMPAKIPAQSLSRSRLTVSGGESDSTVAV